MSDLSTGVLKRRFYGESEYVFLQAAFEAGITAADLLSLVGDVGDFGEVTTTISTDGNGNLTIARTSNFGISAGVPYYNTAGASSGEDARLVTSSQGALALTEL